MNPYIKNNDNETTVPVRRGRVGSVDLFEVKEHELEILENGSSDGNSSIFLNFSIFLISLSASSIFSICTASFTRPIFQTLFLIIAVIGSLGGILLLILWWSKRQTEQASIKSIVKTIRDRILDCPVPENTKIKLNQTETSIEISTVPVDKKS